MRTRPRSTLRPRPARTLRAYRIAYPDSMADDDYTTLIVFARSKRSARRCAENYEPGDHAGAIKATRARVFDAHRHKGKVPPQALLDDGWKFECHAPGCNHTVPCDEDAEDSPPLWEDGRVPAHPGGPVVRGDAVYCGPQCVLDTVRYYAMRAGYERGARFRVAELFVGVDATMRYVVAPHLTRPSARTDIVARVQLIFHASDAPLFERDVLDFDLRLGDASVDGATAAVVRRLHDWLRMTEQLGAGHPLCIGLAPAFARLKLAPPGTSAASDVPKGLSPPGATVADVMELHALDPDEMAGKLGWTLDALDAFLAGTVVLTDDLASRLVPLFGYTADFWRERERQYRASLAVQRERHALDAAFNQAERTFAW